MYPELGAANWQLGSREPFTENCVWLLSACQMDIRLTSCDTAKYERCLAKLYVLDRHQGIAPSNHPTTYLGAS